MKVREPIQEFFGTSDPSNLLDQDVYSSQELKEDRIRLRRERQSIRSEMNEQADEYTELLRKGAEADEHDRQHLAQQAKIAKKKYEIKKQQYKKNSLVLGTVVAVEGAREIMEMHDADSATNIEELVHEGDVNVEEVQEHVMDQMVQYELDMDVMQEIQDSLDVDIISPDVQVGGDEELEKMEQMAAGEIEAEQVDLDEEVEAEPEVGSTPGELDDIDELDDLDDRV